MDAVVIVLRVLHVGGGLFWAGAGLASSWFVQPAARAAGAPGQAFMEKLMGESKLGPAMGVSAIATLGSGIALYWIDFEAVVPFSAPMLGFAIGGLAGIAVWLISVLVTLPAGSRMQELGAAARAGEDVGAEMARLGARMSRAGTAAVWLLIVAVVMMAVSRYL